MLIKELKNFLDIEFLVVFLVMHIVFGLAATYSLPVTAALTVAALVLSNHFCVRSLLNSQLYLLWRAAGRSCSFLILLHGFLLDVTASTLMVWRLVSNYDICISSVILFAVVLRVFLLLSTVMVRISPIIQSFVMIVVVSPIIYLIASIADVDNAVTLSMSFGFWCVAVSVIPASAAQIVSMQYLLKPVIVDT